MFDMTVDDATDAAMQDIEADEQEARAQEQRRTQNIVNVASRHLGEDVRDLPYLPISSASSSSKGPYPDLPAEDTSNPRGRPPKNPAMNDGSENTTQKRGRKPLVAGVGSNPMIVNDEGTQQKRSKSGDTPSPPPTKKQKEEKEMKKIQKAIEQADKAEAKQMIKIEKAVAKADKAAAKAAAKSKARGSKDSSDGDVEISGVSINRNKTMKFWREQRAKELGNQLKLRDLQKFKDEWAFKSRVQLLEIIQDLIKKNKW